MSLRTLSNKWSRNGCPGAIETSTPPVDIILVHVVRSSAGMGQTFFFPAFMVSVDVLCIVSRCRIVSFMRTIPMSAFFEVVLSGGAILPGDGMPPPSRMGRCLNPMRTISGMAVSCPMSSRPWQGCMGPGDVPGICHRFVSVRGRSRLAATCGAHSWDMASASDNIIAGGYLESSEDDLILTCACRPG